MTGPWSTEQTRSSPQQSSTILARARRSPGAETGGIVWHSGTLGSLQQELQELDWTLGARVGRRRTQPVSPANNQVPMSRQLWISLFISQTSPSTSGTVSDLLVFDPEGRGIFTASPDHPTQSGTQRNTHSLHASSLSDKEKSGHVSRVPCGPRQACPRGNCGWVCERCVVCMVLYGRAHGVDQVAAGACMHLRQIRYSRSILHLWW